MPAAHYKLLVGDGVDMFEAMGGYLAPSVSVWLAMCARYLCHPYIHIWGQISLALMIA
jgi:hypothetical protein